MCKETQVDAIERYGDISKWNVSNVTNMSGLFEGGDISEWDKYE